MIILNRMAKGRRVPRKSKPVLRDQVNQEKKSNTVVPARPRAPRARPQNKKGAKKKKRGNPNEKNPKKKSSRTYHKNESSFPHQGNNPKREHQKKKAKTPTKSKSKTLTLSKRTCQQLPTRTPAKGKKSQTSKMWYGKIHHKTGVLKKGEHPENTQKKLERV